MEEQSSATRRAKKAELDHLVVPAYEIQNYLQGVSSLIAQRAYEIFEKRGKARGHDWEDWFRAEAEVLRQVTYELADAGDAFVAIAAVDDCSPEDVRISVEPRCVRIWGLSAANDQRPDASPREVSNCRAFLVSLNLPADINTCSISADMRDGILKVRLPKVLSETEV